MSDSNEAFVSQGLNAFLNDSHQNVVPDAVLTGSSEANSTFHGGRVDGNAERRILGRFKSVKYSVSVDDLLAASPAFSENDERIEYILRELGGELLSGDEKSRFDMLSDKLFSDDDEDRKGFREARAQLRAKSLELIGLHRLKKER